MVTMAMNGGPVPEPPKLELGHWVAILLELVIAALALKGSMWALIPVIIYGLRFSATRAGLMILKGY